MIDDSGRVLGARLDRRAVLRGGLIGGAGLAAAAMIGCGDDDDDDDDAATTATAAATSEATAAGSATAEGTSAPATSAGPGLIQDPNLPYPYQFPEPDKAPKAGGTLKVAVTWDVQTFDPTTSAAGGTITVPNVAYNRLLGFASGPRFDPFTIELEPELASTWERTPDGTVFSFTLRDDVKWQNVDPLNGRPFVAADVKYAFDRYAAEGVHQSIWANISSTEAVDDHTFKATMGTVTADFLLNLAGRYQTIFPKELAEDGSIAQKVIGTGPMIMTKAEQGSVVEFTKNPDWWGSEVYLDGVEFRVMTDAAARLAAFRVGQVDYAYTVGAALDELNALLDTNPDTQVNLAPLTQSWSFGMNLSNPKFQDERVRQGITLAIDKDLIRSLVFSDFAKSLHQQPWDYVWDEEPTAENGLLGQWNPRFAPEEAKKLLAAAGASDLSFDSIYYTYGSYIQQWTEILLDLFGDVGIKMTPKSVDYTEFNSTWVPGKLEEASTSAWGAAGYDADNYYFNQLHSTSPGNRWKLNDPKVDELAQAQSTELDPDKRKEILQELWTYELEKMYFPPLATGIQVQTYQPWLRGMRFGGPKGSSSYYYDWGAQIPGAWLDK